jgi:hypothetical protein
MQAKDAHHGSRPEASERRGASSHDDVSYGWQANVHELEVDWSMTVSSGG